MLTKLSCTIVSAAAAVLAVGAFACQDSRAANAAENRREATPASSTAANTNAIVEKVDPLAGIANRDRLVADPNASVIDPPKAASLLTGASTTVRSGPRGSMLEVLESTANVLEVERDGDYFLVTYPTTNAKGVTQLFAGWVYRDSLVGEGSTLLPGTPRAAGKLACTHGESHIRTTQDFCAKTCKQDSDCDSAKGGLCDGVAFEVNERKNELSNTRFCLNLGPGAAAPKQ